MAVLSERGIRMLETLAPFEAEDPAVIAVMRAGADELDLIEQAMLTVRDQAWAHKADDTHGLLAVHERTLRLPVAPPGASIAQRQTVIKARMQSRRSGWKADWVKAMDALLGAGQWSCLENNPLGNQLKITIPFALGGYTATQAEQLARERTPAHVQIVMAYVQGFIVGVSTVGSAI